MISIIILNWNGEQWLGPLFESLEKQTCREFEIISADNNSSDSSVKIASTFKRVRIFSFLTNSGYATANNIASSVALGDYLLFLNSDTLLDPFCIEHMRSFTLQNKYGIGACLVTDYSGLDRQQC